MMGDVSRVVRALRENGENVQVICDNEGWVVMHNDRLAYCAADGNDLLAFLRGIASRYIQ